MSLLSIYILGKEIFMFFRNMNLQNRNVLRDIANSTPFAIARIKGSQEYPDIVGTVKFFNTTNGVIVFNDIKGLTQTQTNIFAEHIHQNGECFGDFESAGAHFNPTDVPHPQHAGDLPPLFSAGGNALSAVLTDRFTLNQIIGKTVIIHENPDDFVTQPSGNSGARIACGIIERYNF